MSSTDKREIIFKKFLSKSKIFIIDPNSSTRARILKAFIDFGASYKLTHIFGKIDDVYDSLKKIIPNIVVSEYELDNRVDQESWGSL